MSRICLRPSFQSQIQKPIVTDLPYIGPKILVKQKKLCLILKENKGFAVFPSSAPCNSGDVKPAALLIFWSWYTSGKF